jgi:hypothetical protein
MHNMIKIAALFVFVLGSVALFQSCGSNDVATPEVHPNPVSSGEPVESPTRTPTINAELANDLYKDSGGNLTENFPNGLIKEGQTIGPLSIGMVREEVETILGIPTEEYTQMRCGILALHWNDLKYNNRGVYVFLRNGEVFQIDTYSQRFSLPSLAVEDLPSKLPALYPDLKAYEMQNSSAIVDGGRNLVFWIDSEKGIAFELYNFQGQTRSYRRIGSISVFDSSVGYYPKGSCKENTIQPLVLKEKWYSGN